ncbi:uncharacterized protein DSM5745_11282 [Aspergillus mulundensis]|uniref:Uncharacterized protein n=1 Tax=Aspergillus mulundensis TaxID=1810919 RepID=A0A3D8Q7V5_9EURO|nr:hypothetical protein DSM5745_11282 [Aspergillus mulundensis]RDW57902.1 hypothetical protein DSM5745_11282 [Aspergillus mulundensis]
MSLMDCKSIRGHWVGAEAAPKTDGVAVVAAGNAVAVVPHIVALGAVCCDLLASATAEVDVERASGSVSLFVGEAGDLKNAGTAEGAERAGNVEHGGVEVELVLGSVILYAARFGDSEVAEVAEKGAGQVPGYVALRSEDAESQDADTEAEAEVAEAAEAAGVGFGRVPGFVALHVEAVEVEVAEYEGAESAEGTEGIEAEAGGNTVDMGALEVTRAAS